MNTSEYYLLYATSEPNSPAIILDDSMDEIELPKDAQIMDLNLVKFKFWEPYPKHPLMTDYHDNGILGCISRKIHSILDLLKIKNFQMLPATILDPRNNVVYDNYYYLHTYNQISCLDMEQSMYRANRGGRLRSISKLELSKEILKDIPLKDRLIFRLGEFYAFQIFHKSIVDAIMATNPEGIRFVPVEDYNIGSAFD